MVIQITSLQNPKVKLAVKLKDRRDRDKTALFLIEGYRELTRAIRGNERLEALFFCPSLFLGENENALIEGLEKEGVELFEASEAVFRHLSYRDRPDGLLAIATMQRKSLSSLPLSKNPFFVVAEAIEKPGNLGTILRSADGAGADGVIVADKCTDIFNPNVVRSSVGTLFTVPVVEAPALETLHWLINNGIQIVAATPEATLSYTQADFKGPVAIVVGTEQYGLSPLWREKATIKVKIPMCGVADSLNVSVATALLLYEVYRQRNT